MLLPYHFVQPRADVDFAPFLARFRAATPAGGRLCFDLEDSLQGATPAATAAAKFAGRRALAALLGGPHAPDPAQVVIRVNPVGTAAYLADVCWLATVPAPRAVLLPKVADVASVRRALADLPPGVAELIVTVESAAGLRAVPALAAFSADARFTTVALGHCDLNLSLGHFPFQHHTSPTYWQWVAYLDRHLAPAGKRLLNSPVLRLADDSLLVAVLRRFRTYRSAVGQLTLSLAQSRWCGTPTAVDFKPDFSDDFGSDCAADSDFTSGQSDPVFIARRLLAAAAAHPVPGSALALTPARRIIAPQEVIAARRVLAGCSPAIPISSLETTPSD